VPLVAFAIGALGLATQAAVPDILVGDSPVELTLKAPFADLFARAQSKPDYEVKGELTWSVDGSRPATVEGVVFSERGHTSRQVSECTFPKLKIDLGDASRAGTPFEDIDTLKLGTHCGDRSDDELTPKYGRLGNERAPAREAMVYRILHAAGIPTLLARPARTTYLYADGSDRQPLTRMALLLEDDDDAQVRLGASGQFDETSFGAAREAFDARDTARLAFAEAMIGNFDWCLRMFQGDIYRCDERHPLWNVLAFERPGRTALPLPYDFDLAGPVVGRHVWFGQVFSADYVEPPSGVSVEVQAQVQRTRSLFGRALLDETRAYFMGVRSKVMAAIESAAADDRGKDLAREYVTAFYQAIEADDIFYGPVVLEGGHQAFLASDGSRPACGEGSAVPEGTPVSRPLEVNGEYTQVRVLDALWEWTGNKRCDVVHRQPVWIRSAAIGSSYPR
jgi:hypothetical protein